MITEMIAVFLFNASFIGFLHVIAAGPMLEKLVSLTIYFLRYAGRKS